MKNEKPVIELTQYLSGEFYYKEGCPKGISVTILLGGKENVRKSRWYCFHGYGAWITEWCIINIETAKQSIVKHNYNYIITKGEEVLERSN